LTNPVNNGGAVLYRVFILEFTEFYGLEIFARLNGLKNSPARMFLLNAALPLIIVQIYPKVLLKVYDLNLLVQINIGR
jgi:hypothetical protein